MVPETLRIVTLVWLTAPAVLFPVLLRVTVPYGRHASPRWGPLMPTRLAWFLMEAVALTAFPTALLRAGGPAGTAAAVTAGAFLLHYLNRTAVFPLQLPPGRTVPAAVAAMGVAFNAINGTLNGWWLALVPAAGPAWYREPRFLAGCVTFAAGMALNVVSDQKLLALRRREGRHAVPRGGPFELVSCPNLLGEIVEWTGWAVMAANPAAAAFAVWTAANLIPRALAHHRWLRERFPDYPPRRRAIVPFLL